MFDAHAYRVVSAHGCAQVIVNPFDWGRLLQGRQVPKTLASFRPAPAPAQAAAFAPRQQAASMMELSTPAFAARDVLQECRAIVHSMLGTQVLP